MYYNSTVTIILCLWHVITQKISDKNDTKVKKQVNGILDSMSEIDHSEKY